MFKKIASLIIRGYQRLRAFCFRPSVKYSVSFDASVQLKELPQKRLTLTGCDFFCLDTRVGVVEIVAVDSKKKTVTFTEVCTDNTHTVDLATFEYLFVSVGVKPLEGTERLV